MYHHGNLAADCAKIKTLEKCLERILEPPVPVTSFQDLIQPLTRTDLWHSFCEWAALNTLYPGLFMQAYQNAACMLDHWI